MKINGKNFVVVEVDDVLEETYVGDTSYGSILVRVGDEEKLLPKSQLEDWPDVGERGEVIVQEWLAIKKGLI